MVFVSPYFQKVYLESLGYFLADGFYLLVYLVRENYLSVFSWADEMIDEDADIVAFVNIDTHPSIIPYSAASRGELTLITIKTWINDYLINIMELAEYSFDWYNFIKR